MRVDMKRGGWEKQAGLCCNFIAAGGSPSPHLHSKIFCSGGKWNFIIGTIFLAIVGTQTPHPQPPSPHPLRSSTRGRFPSQKANKYAHPAALTSTPNEPLRHPAQAKPWGAGGVDEGENGGAVLCEGGGAECAGRVRGLTFDSIPEVDDAPRP